MRFALLLLVGVSAHAADLLPRNMPPEVLTGYGEIMRLAPRASGEGASWRLRVDARPDYPHDFGLRYVFPQSFAKGHGAVLKFALRDVGAHPDAARVLLFFRSVNPEKHHPLSLQFEAIADGQWREFSLPFGMAFEYAGNEAEFLVMPGLQLQTLEIADIRIENLPPGVDPKSVPFEGFFYQGREPEAPWRKAAAARIRTHRSSDAVLTVVDDRGNPVPDATISVRLVHHDFRFGSAIDAGFVLGGGPDSEQYRTAFLSHFNTAVPENDLKWKALDGEWEGFTLERALKLLQWCGRHGIYVRGHTLVWPGWETLPERIAPLKDNPPELRKVIDAHIRSLARSTRGLVDDWDVLNEPRSNHDVQDVLGPEIMAEWFHAAHETDPEAILYLNENGILSEGGRDLRHHELFETLLRDLVDKKVHLGGIGLQAHMGWTLTDPEKLLATFDRFAKFGLPVTVTEFTVNLQDETLQADYTRDFLTAAFSHPGVAGVLHWGFWEGRHWNPDAALFRKDWTPKPSAQVLQNLLKEQWYTEFKGRTDARGGVRFRAFHGEYSVTITRRGHKPVEKTVQISAARPHFEMRLPAPER